MSLSTQSMQSSTSASCWAPVPSSLRPGLMSLEVLPKMCVCCLFFCIVLQPHLIPSAGRQTVEGTADDHAWSSRAVNGS